jgi:hypothetical protein
MIHLHELGASFFLFGLICGRGRHLRVYRDLLLWRRMTAQASAGPGIKALIVEVAGETGARGDLKMITDFLTTDGRLVGRVVGMAAGALEIVKLRQPHFTVTKL